MVSVLLISTLGSSLIALSTLLPTGYSAFNKILTAGITLGTMSAYTACLFYVKYRANLVVAANLFAASAFLGIGLPIIISGGLAASPVTPLLFVVPVWAFLMAGRLWGLAWTIITVLYVMLYYLAYQLGIEFQQVIAQEHIVGSFYSILLLTIVVITACFYVYETHVETLTAKLEEQSRRFAYDSLHDPLTGLSNRKLFDKHANQAIDFALTENLKAAIIYIDLDDFKPINDNYGHHIGDQVLKSAAHRMRTSIRSSDTASRLGGDEFAVLLHGAKDIDSIKFVANKILNAVCQPIDVESQTLTVGASLGVVIIPDNGIQLEAVLKLADETMYQAKKSKNTVCFYGNLY